MTSLGAAQEGTAGIWNRLRRALAKTEEKDRKLAMHMAQKIARPKSNRGGRATIRGDVGYVGIQVVTSWSFAVQNAVALI
jgi:hypothetical protein